MRTSHKINPPPKQTGAALLLFILLLVVGAATMLVSKMNKAAAQYYRDDVTMKALLKAKEALIGYAVSYPDMINPLQGPGHLPCPDRDNDGLLLTEGACSFSGNTFLGRLPWKYMGIDEIRDSSGEVLWYAISDNYRFNPPGNINSETPGQLTIDSDASGTGDDEDVVAVILAPGKNFNGKSRPSNTAADYLEGGNADGNFDFVTTAAGDFNDQVLVITRRELMNAVEKRVLGEVSQVLRTYKNNYENFIWLSPYEDPTTIDATFDGVPSTREGHLPIHITDPANEVFDVSSLGNFSATWNFSGGSFPPPGVLDCPAIPPNTLCKDDLQNSGYLDPIFGSVLLVGQTCLWTNKDEIDCTAVKTGIGGETRTYNFLYKTPDYPYPPLAPTAPNWVRLRQFDLVSTPPINASIEIIDTDSGGNETGRGTVDFSSGASGTFNLDVVYDLDPNESEIPLWLVSNKWHHLIYVAYSLGDIPGAVSPCIVGSGCLSIFNQPAANNVGVLAVIASSAPPGNLPRVALQDYFENENVSTSLSDYVFERKTFTSDVITFNDQLRIISP